MAVKIKLTRLGKKKAPKYRIVAVEGSKKRDGKYLEKVGFYDPMSEPHVLAIDQDKLKAWLEKGARLSEGARKLLKS